MIKNPIKVIVSALSISVIGVYIIDYFSHLLFSEPMETTGYFLGKFTVFFVFSILFLSYINLTKREFKKVLIGGIVVASIWGSYYNVLPILFDYYPAGIALNGLTFLNMGLFGTGVAFGIVHTTAFVGGYYLTKVMFKKWYNNNITS